LNRGRLPVLCTETSNQLLRIVDDNRAATISEIRDDFFYKVFGNQCPYFHLSTSTISRELHKQRWSRKLLKRRNYRANIEDQLQYLEKIGFLEPRILINIDGMAHNSDDFLRRYGWAPVGDEATLVQLWINNRQYSVHAAYCYYGFVAWTINFRAYC
jgi:hypothetical protein